jgi:hypothetical protein
LCNATPEGVVVDVVGEDTLAVDLDDGDQLAVARLQLGVTADVHLAQLEPELALERADDGTSPLAQVAALGVVDDDLGRQG